MTSRARCFLFAGRRTCISVPDLTLIAYHLTLAQQRPLTVLSSRTGAPNPKSASTGTFHTPNRMRFVWDSIEKTAVVGKKEKEKTVLELAMLLQRQEVV